jgi:hypothetical protein
MLGAQKKRLLIQLNKVVSYQKKRQPSRECSLHGGRLASGISCS